MTQRQYTRGFTLIELMVAIAVLAIAISTAVPAFTQTIRSTRMQASSDELFAFLLQALEQDAAHPRAHLGLARTFGLAHHLDADRRCLRLHLQHGNRHGAWRRRGIGFFLAATGQQSPRAGHGQPGRAGGAAR